MLFSDQPRPNSRSQMLIQESCYDLRADIFSAFEKATRQSRYCLRVCFYEFCEDCCESDLVLEVGDCL